MEDLIKRLRLAKSDGRMIDPSEALDHIEELEKTLKKADELSDAVFLMSYREGLDPRTSVAFDSYCEVRKGMKDY